MLCSNDTVESSEKLGEMNFQLFQETKVRLTGAAIVGLLLGGPYIGVARIEFRNSYGWNLFSESRTFAAQYRDFMAVP